MKLVMPTFLLNTVAIMLANLILFSSVADAKKDKRNKHVNEFLDNVPLRSVDYDIVNNLEIERDLYSYSQRFRIKIKKAVAENLPRRGIDFNIKAQVDGEYRLINGVIPPYRWKLLPGQTVHCYDDCISNNASASVLRVRIKERNAGKMYTQYINLTACFEAYINYDGSPSRAEVDYSVKYRDDRKFTLTVTCETFTSLAPSMSP